jgi:hypothetical protein
MYQKGRPPSGYRGRPNEGGIWDTCGSRNCSRFGIYARPSIRTWSKSARDTAEMKANVYIFIGPTISASEARLQLDAVYLPPAAEGDVYRMGLKSPKVIGIIDGYFQFTPAVRHKEILWAMSRGIHVLGSASMGALRAAELAAFGMEGVGTVFELYRDGTLEDDDEVALVHGPVETGFIPGSEAMVNIRRTLQEASHAAVISTEVKLSLERIAKQMYYPNRNYSVLIRRAHEFGLPNQELDQLRRWLPKGQVNQKRQDAIAMLQLIRQRLAEGLKPKKVTYVFEPTAMWEMARRQSKNRENCSSVDRVHAANTAS